MLGGTPAQDPLSQVVPGKEDMGDDYDAIVVQMTQLMEHSDPAQKPPWDGSGLPETAAEMQELEPLLKEGSTDDDDDEGDDDDDDGDHDDGDGGGGDGGGGDGEYIYIYIYVNIYIYI